jgi:hypothetical protein
MKKKSMFLLVSAMLFGATAAWVGCKKESNSNNSSNASSNYVLSISTGAQTIEPGGTIAYKAVLVDKNGNTSTPANVSWSVSGSGGASIGSFGGGVFTSTGTGSGTITASASINGSTVTATVPVGVYAPTLFTVVPSAVIWSTNAGTIPLTPVYIGTSTTSYTYTSSDASIASVDGSGTITFNKVGSCNITVTASGLPGSPVVTVPVMVVGVPSVPLPVVRVAVNPVATQLFRGDATTLTAKAYNGSGAEVSGTATWAVQEPDVATVDQNGRVTALNLGQTVITATINGITGQAEIDVLPDTTIILTPMWVSIAAGATKQFTATTYKVNRSDKSLSVITPNPPLTWTVPTYGISLFDIATVSSTGLVTMRSSATPGLSSIVMAEASSPSVQPGVSMITVSLCDCGTTTPGVTQIRVTSPTTISLSVTSNPTAAIAAQAVDASDNPVSGATLNYCSDAMTVCAVDDSGNLVAASPGTAIITICNGGVQTTITVNVTM